MTQSEAASLREAIDLALRDSTAMLESYRHGHGADHWAIVGLAIENNHKATAHLATLEGDWVLRGIELQRSVSTGLCEVFADFGPGRMVRIIADAGDAIGHHVNWSHVMGDLVPAMIAAAPKQEGEKG